MPLPKPKKNETQDEFIERCMSDETMKEEYPDNDQRLAICFTQWKNKDKENKSMKREIRTFELDDIEVRSEDDKPKIKGHAAVFNKLSEDLGGFREKIAPGAFAKTIKKADIRALFNHDPNYVLGRNKSGTLNLEEDEKGLAIEIDPPDTTFAKDLMISIKRGDITQMSFAFNTIEDSWENQDKKDSIRTLIEVELFDVSPVTYPAYSQTDVKVRALIGDEVLEVIEKAERGESLTVEDGALLKITIDKLRGYINEPDLVNGGAHDDGYVRWLDKNRRELDLAELS